MPKWKVDIAVSTDMANPETNNIERLIQGQGQSKTFVITEPGEYEVKNIFVYGVAHPQNPAQTLFVIEAEGMTLGHLGIAPDALGDAELEYFEGVDILLLPLTGIAPKMRAALVSSIEPRMIIPLYYKTPGVTLPLESPEPFLKEMGIKNATPEKKLIVKQRQLPAEETQVVLLQTT